MPVSYLETLLMRDEEVIYAAKLHWITTIPGIVFTCLAWYLAEAGPANLLLEYGRIQLPEKLNMILNYLVLGMCIVGVIMILEAYLRTQRTELVITNRRVMAKFGIFSRTTFELFLSKVEGPNIQQGILGRMLGFGSIHVRGTGSGMTPIDNIKDPEIFQRVLLEQIRRRHEHEERDPNPPFEVQAKHD